MRSPATRAPGRGGRLSPSDIDERFRMAFADAAVGMAMTRPDGGFLQVNAAYCRITGYSQAELLATDFQSITHPDDRARNLADIQRMLDGEVQSFVIEKRYVRKDRTVIWVKNSVIVARRADGSPQNLVAFVEDVTRGRRAEEAQEASEARFRAVFDGALDAMLLADSDGRYVEANQAACALVGRTRDEILGTPVGSLSAPGFDARRVWRETRLDTGRSTGRWRLMRSDGTTREVEYALTTDVLPGLHLSVLRDLTDRSAVEDTLRREREVLKAIMDNIPVMISFADREGRVEWINGQFERVLGWTLAEARTVDIMAVALPDDVRLEARQFYESLAPGWRDFPTRTKSGRNIQTAWANVPLSDGGVICIGQDVTERKRTEEDRERRLAQLQALADAALKIGKATTVGEITTAVTEAARRIIGAHTSVTSLTVDQNWAQAITATSLSAKYAAYRDYDAKPDGSGIYRLVCLNNRPLRLTEAELQAHSAFRGFGVEGSRHPPVRGWLAVPLVARDGQNLGLVQLSDKYEGDFGEADEAILVQLAQLASEAVENARLLEEISAGRARLEALSRRLVSLQEEERRSIAQGLHDEVGQLLTGLGLMLEDEVPVPARREERRKVVNEIIGRVRDLSMNLRPPMLDPLGLLPTLLWQIERFEAQTKIQVEFHYANLDRRFAAEVELTAFRVVQEALTNVARHAGVARAKVEVWAQADSLGARIADEGRGFLVEAALAGHSSGLAGMLERSRLIGGRLAIESAPGAGTRLSLDLPLAPEPRTGGRG